MAVKPKKKLIKPSSNKKKSIRKNVTVNSKKQTAMIKKNLLIIFIVLGIISLVAFGYFLGKEKSSNQLQEKKIFDHLSKLKTTLPMEEKKLLIQKSLKKDKVNQLTRQKRKEDKNDVNENIKPITKIEKTKLAYRGKKPKLVIIIDDVHTKKQIKSIKDLNMKITPSIFPPYALARESHLLANDLEYYMIHLPMQSSSKQFNTQYKTLMTSFSGQQIEERVKELRQLFPSAKYINNHTGSIFTQNYAAMKKLYISLRMEGFVFVDSFTTASSKVRKIAHEIGDVYVRRDTFIDNVHTEKAIRKQLKLAVKKAKQNGYAIAIGHPHNITMDALINAKDIFQDVELVYINDIYM